MRAEADRFGELAVTPEAKALMSIFFAQTALKKNRFGTPAKEPKTIGCVRTLRFTCVRSNLSFFRAVCLVRV